MVRPSAEIVDLASHLVKSQVDGLPPTTAKLYSHYTRLKENQPGLMSWSQTEANRYLDDVMRLLEAASVQRQIEDTLWKNTVLRAGEILEWLPYTDINSEEISTRLLAAACYQLAGYPARASGLLREDGNQYTESRILIALLKADFVGLLQQIAEYWSQTMQEVQHFSDVSPSENQNERLIQTMIVRETVSALGLLCSVMRWGNDSRIQKALDKLTAVSKVVVHGRNPYSWILSKLCAEVAATYVENSMRQHLDILIQNMSSSGRGAFERYLRHGFLSGKSMAWPSQLRGIQALASTESFALCTPTGSGKTTIAELAILQSLFPTNDDRSQSSLHAPLVMYLVPSRALATEVEVKLSRVLRQSTHSSQRVNVTGLYGGTDWGPTDAWLTADEKTVLICTYEKAEALLKFLGSLFLPRTTLIVIDEAHTIQFSGTNESLQKSENRSLRLESLGARLFSYVQHNAPLQFAGGENADRPYIPSPFPAYPQSPKFEGKNFTTAVHPYVLWAAMHLAAPDDRGQQRAVLISISQKINDYAKDFLELLCKTWVDIPQLPQFFQVPSDERKREVWQKCLNSCEDYYTTSSREYRLLTKGIVVHHGKMPGLMARLLIEVVEEKIVHLVMATSTLSEGVNLPFETILIPSLMRWNGNFSPSEFKNLVGRAGRPGFGTEGRSLVLIPEQPRQTPIRNLYNSFVRKLQEPPIDRSESASSPLAVLIQHLRDKWHLLVQNGSDTEFLIWLEQTAPITLQPDDSIEDAIESLDSLDNVLLAAIVEIEQISGREMEPNQLEDELRRLWQQTYAYYASQNQAQLQGFFVHRGKALKSNIYPTTGERKRLYKTSLPPRSGNQLLSFYPSIKEHLKTGINYLSYQDNERFRYIKDSIQLVGQVNTFTMEHLTGKGIAAARWEEVLHWWLCHQRAPRKPTETQISRWHTLASQNFSYKFNWGLGSVIALASEEALGELDFSLDNWPSLGLPWIVFWMKELIVWGTLDPVAAYLLARVDEVTTRTQAEELSQVYYESVSTLEPDARLNPTLIRDWAQRAYAPTVPTIAPLRPSPQISVGLLRDFSRASKQTWRVIPVEIDNEIHWLDPAGFPLASCQKPENWQVNYLHKYDFELNSSEQIITSTLYL